MFNKIGCETCISSNEEEILKADKIILPGVGHFDYGMQQLKASGLAPILNQIALVDKKPVLGICLGAQLLLESSEEGEEPGLGWIEGKSVKFDKSQIGNELRIPHMGWSDVQKQQDHPILKNFDEAERFYFVHSYYMQTNPENQILSTTHGFEFTAGIAKENIIGVQFHPEKSHRFGMKLLKNFSELKL